MPRSGARPDPGGQVSVALGAVPPERAGMASATVTMTREVGGVAGVAVMGAVLTARFESVLRERLPSGGAADTSALTHAVTAGGPAGGLPERTGRVVNQAFVMGLHLAALVSAAVLCATAAAVLLLMRPPRRDTAAEAAGALVRRS
ncbi:hypothetical protein [Streptomyces sp. I05A-00742]|uniref:hypothetical protein n=1 Tax=Streptomyces sp. I05A-00742 TaxID=2732853 RepID=UPI0014881077|nr:hypothetical protein [Streptomyces sp. I05A-00742]